MSESRPITVYADMCADLFHPGHVNFLRQARALGDSLIVGVHSDADVASYKRVPVLTMQERVAMVQACRYVDRVIPNAPLYVTPDYLGPLGVDVVCHGDDLDAQGLAYFYEAIKGKLPLRLVPYTEGVCSSDIIKRVAHRFGPDGDPKTKV